MIGVIALSLAASAIAGGDKNNLSPMGLMCSVGSTGHDDLFFFSADGGDAGSQIKIEPVPIPGRAYSWTKEKLLILNSMRFVDGKQSVDGAVGTWEVSGVQGAQGGKAEFTITFSKRLADGSQNPPIAEFRAVIGDQNIKAPCTYVPPAPASLESK